MSFVFATLLACLAVRHVAAYATGSCCARRCSCDSAGPDDEGSLCGVASSHTSKRRARTRTGGAQKDLNKMCSLSTPSSSCADVMSQEVAWNWDQVDFQGANSHDAWFVCVVRSESLRQK